MLGWVQAWCEGALTLVLYQSVSMSDIPIKPLSIYKPSAVGSYTAITSFKNVMQMMILQFQDNSQIEYTFSCILNFPKLPIFNILFQNTLTHKGAVSITLCILIRFSFLFGTTLKAKILHYYSFHPHYFISISQFCQYLLYHNWN